MLVGEPVRAAAYVRALPAEQSRNGLSAEDQRSRLEAYSAERGWELVRTYVDQGIAARPRFQPELERLASELEGLNKIVVARLDRFGLQTRRLARLLRRLEDAQIELVSLDDGFDTGAESGRAVPQLLSSVADWPWWDWQPDNLAKPGLAPATLIDVGVADGTVGFYHAFPSAHLDHGDVTRFSSQLILRGYVTEKRGMGAKNFFSSF